ncbi:MAG: NAD(+) diphosphatase [Eubacterium sp.]|nr:NAD(+) diphosphatase [Eubacterium sp.]
MIQDIYPHRLKNEYEPPEVIPEDAIIYHFDGMNVLVGDQEGLHFPVKADLNGDETLQFLFHIDETPCYLLESTKPVEIAGFSYSDLRHLRRKDLEKKHLVYGAYTAKHLAEWYEGNHFCGRCGHKMEHSKTERAMVCPNCEHVFYPQIMPAVIVGVINQDSLLLTRYREGYKYNALVAGFTEIGETAEECVRREVMEETGIKVKNIRYYKSQPWGFAQNLLLGYYCEVDGDDTIQMDTSELRYAQWVKREEIELQPDNFSLTNEMMCRFQNGQE